MSVFKDIWNDVKQPSSDDESAYHFALIGIAHFVLGAALACVFPAWFAIIGYTITKEIPDHIYRDGSLVDGMIDVGFVGLGAITFAMMYWPLICLMTVALVVYVKYR